MRRILSILQAPKDTSGKAPPDELQLAVAALLVEAAYMDGDFGDEERATIRDLLLRQFEIPGDEADDLLDAADREVEESGELWRFARTVKDRYDEDERVRMIEMLWEVVYADGELHDFEANLLRRIAGLIYVPDRDSGAARKRVLQRMGIAED